MQSETGEQNGSLTSLEQERHQAYMETQPTQNKTYHALSTATFTQCMTVGGGGNVKCLRLLMQWLHGHW